MTLVLTEDRVGWYTETSGLHLKPRTDLTAAETTVGREGRVVHALPLDRLQEAMRRYGRGG